MKNKLEENAMTNSQKEYLLTLLRRAELDTRTCGLFHTRLAEEARIDSPRPGPGDSIDAWFQTLTKVGAGRLIGTLRDRVGGGP